MTAGFKPFVHLDPPALSPTQRASPGVSGIRPRAGSIGLEQAVNGTGHRQNTWSMSPPVANWNDLWPMPPGSPELILDVQS